MPGGPPMPSAEPLTGVSARACVTKHAISQHLLQSPVSLPPARQSRMALALAAGGGGVPQSAARDLAEGDAAAGVGLLGGQALRPAVHAAGRHAPGGLPGYC